MANETQTRCPHEQGLTGSPPGAEAGAPASAHPARGTRARGVPCRGRPPRPRPPSPPNLSPWSVTLVSTWALAGERDPGIQARRRGTYSGITFWSQRVCHPGPEPRAGGLDGHRVAYACQLATRWKRAIGRARVSVAVTRLPAGGARRVPSPLGLGRLLNSGGAPSPKGRTRHPSPRQRATEARWARAGGGTTPGAPSLRFGPGCQPPETRLSPLGSGHTGGSGSHSCHGDRQQPRARSEAASRRRGSHDASHQTQGRERHSRRLPAARAHSRGPGGPPRSRWAAGGPCGAVSPPGQAGVSLPALQGTAPLPPGEHAPAAACRVQTGSRGSRRCSVT